MKKKGSERGMTERINEEDKTAVESAEGEDERRGVIEKQKKVKTRARWRTTTAYVCVIVIVIGIVRVHAFPQFMHFL